MKRLEAWFNPGLLDMLWCVLFGHFIGYTKEETKAYFVRLRNEDSIDNFNDILHNEGEEFK